MTEVGAGYKFTEGGARDKLGNVYFTDIPNNRIHYWNSKTGEITVFRENCDQANGTWVDEDGNLIVCQMGARKLALFSPNGSQRTLVDSYEGKSLNSPNDLWVDAKGGIYFTDPRYGSKRDDMEQDGEHVYYLLPDGSEAIRIANDLVRPNGIMGTKDGKTLYIADFGAKKTFAYNINPDGTVSDKRLFADVGSDGIALDNKGNVYLTPSDLQIYSKKGKLLGEIRLPQKPSNVCFGGEDAKTLFITARKSIYTLPMKVRGIGSN